jgi:hypothetical protein
MKTTTETKNFKEVLVSTVIYNGRVETIIFFNGCDIWQTVLVQDIEKQHKIGVKVAESYTYENCGVEPIFYRK